DLAPFAHGACLQYQLAGFANGHKISNNLLVGNRYWATSSDLFSEVRNNGAIGAQYIPETGSNEPCIATFMVLKRLHIHFRSPFGSSHYIGGVYRLIGRDHHKFLHVILYRKICEINGSPDIDIHRFMRIFFNQWYMFVSCGVIYHIKLIFGKKHFHPFQIPDVCQQNIKIKVTVILVHKKLHIVQGRFRIIQNNNLFRIKFRYLFYNLTSYGASASRNEYGFMVQIFFYKFTIGSNWRSIQQILYLYWFDLGMYILFFVPLLHK